MVSENLRRKHMRQCPHWHVYVRISLRPSGVWGLWALGWPQDLLNDGKRQIGSHRTAFLHHQLCLNILVFKVYMSCPLYCQWKSSFIQIVSQHADELDLKALVS